jgi:hypothetical protein
MEEYVVNRQVNLNVYNSGASSEDHSADRPVLGSFSAPSHLREGLDLPGVGKSCVEDCATNVSTALTWAGYSAQRVSDEDNVIEHHPSDCVGDLAIDFIASETSAPPLLNPLGNMEFVDFAQIAGNLATQICAFVMRTDRSFIQMVASINGILMALKLDTHVYRWIVSEVCSLATGLEVRPESLEELGEALGKDVVKFITANLSSVVEKLVKFCSAALIAPSLMQSKMYYIKNIGCALNKERLSSFMSASLTVDAVVAMMAHCVTRGVEHLVNWSFPDEVNTLLRESCRLREVAESTLSTMDRETRDELLLELDATQCKLVNKHKSVRGDRFTVAQALLRELDAVDKVVTRVRNHAIHSARVPAPLSVMLVGEPAIGKSELTKQIMYIVATVKRPGPNCKPYESYEVCTAPMSKYWNNMTNQTKVVIFDDVNALVKAGETSQCVAANWAEQLIQLVNNQGFTPELAEAHLKGTVQPHLDIVISTANDENRYGNAPGMRNLDAVFRRYDMIDVVLKDEFKGEDGQIDFRLVCEKGEDIYSVNPWKLSYKKYNLDKAREIARSSVTKRGVAPELWEHITFMYKGEERKSDDITLDMLCELFRQQTATHTDNGDTIARMDRITRERLFPNMFSPDDSIRPQSSLVAANGEWYLYQCYHVAINSSFWLQTLMLVVFPITSILWVFYKTMAWAPPRWLRFIDSNCSYREYCQHCFASCLVHYQILLFCWAFTVAKTTGPTVKFVAGCFGLDLQKIFLSVLLGNRFGGTFGIVPRDRLRTASVNVRRRYVSALDIMADKERRSRMQRVLLKGVFAGLTLKIVYDLAKTVIKLAGDWKLARQYNERIGSEPTSDPQTTIDTNGNITVERDPKIDAVPRQVAFKGSYATLPRDRFRKVDPTQTVDDSRYLAGRCIYRITIRPCYGGQLDSMRYSEYKSEMHVCGYDTYSSGTYMLTVAHAFARDFTHFAVRIHDPSRVTKDYILCKKDIAFAPKMSLGSGVLHDVDLCMFELPRRVTGSLPVIRKLVSDVKLRCGETLTRLIPKHDDANNVHIIDIESGEYMGLQTHTYSAGTPAAKLLPNPISYWVDGSGNDGLCGALLMSGGVVVAMHTGGHATRDMVTACPINDSLLVSMKSRLAGRTLGIVPNARLDDYFIRPPYLEEYTKSNVEISPNVSVRVPGALEPALSDCSYEFVGTLLKNGLPENVKATSSIQQSPHIEFLMDYLPNVPQILRNYAVPSSHWKMRDTIDAFITKSSMSRPVDTHLLALAKEKVGSALYDACCNIVSNNPGFAAMRVFNLQGGLDGKGFNMAGKVPINTSIGVAFSGVKADHVVNAYSPEHNEYFVCFKEDDEISMEIRNSVYDVIERRKNGEVGLIINSLCPKDEVLPVKDTGKTKPMRHINKMDFVHIIVMRMYFQPVLILLGYDPLSCGHSVGLDPTVSYLELIKSLVNGDVDRPLYASEVDDSAFIATDYSGFDLSLSGEVISAVMDILINLTRLLHYTDEDRRVMASIAYDICNPSVVMLGTIIKLTGVNTSGNPLTTIINCVANMIINCQIHAMIDSDVKANLYMVDHSRDYTHLSVDDIRFDIRRIVTYGDDVVIRVDKGSKVTQPATIYYGKQLGYVITGSDKADTVTTYAQDFGFLKRKFNLYVHPRSKEVIMCLAPLAMDSIFKPFVWGDFKKVDINDHYAGLIKSAFHELVQHGEEVYEIHGPKLWAFVQAFSVQDKPRKNAPLIFRSSIKSRFKKPFLSWEDSIKEKYGEHLFRTYGELTLSELELIEL